jgi:hypothetical protein
MSLTHMNDLTRDVMTARSNVVRSVDHQPNLEKVPFEQIGMAPVVAGSRYRVNPGYIHRTRTRVATSLRLSSRFKVEEAIEPAPGRIS